MITQYWRNTLPPPLQQLYDSMAARFAERQTSVTCGWVDGMDIRTVFEMVLNDHPEFFYIMPSGNVSTSPMWGYTFCTQLLYPLAEIDGMQQRIAGVIEEVRARADGSDDVAIEQAVCDYIVETCQYERNDMYNQNAAAALLTGKAQCSGFARAVKWMLDVLGVECLMLSGYTGEPHAWNIVKINGAYYHLDVTAMLAINAYKTRPYLYAFVNYSDTSIGADHRWNRGQLPACPGDFVHNGIFPVMLGTVDSPEQLYAHLKEQSYNGSVDMMVLCNFGMDRPDKLPSIGTETIRRVLAEKRQNKRVQIGLAGQWLCFRIFDTMPSSGGPFARSATGTTRPADGTSGSSADATCGRELPTHAPSTSRPAPRTSTISPRIATLGGDGAGTPPSGTARPTAGTSPATGSTTRPAATAGSPSRPAPLTPEQAAAEADRNTRRLAPVSGMAALRAALLALDYATPCTVQVECTIHAPDEGKLLAAVNDIATQVLRTKPVRRHIAVSKAGNVLTIRFMR